jgi:hypothetical protein
MSDTKQDDLAWIDGPIEAPKWKNLLFMNDGRALLGRSTHDTETVAKKAIEHDERILARHPAKEFAALNGSFIAHQYSHSIQIPWGA